MNTHQTKAAKVRTAAAPQVPTMQVGGQVPPASLKQLLLEDTGRGVLLTPPRGQTRRRSPEAY